MSLLNKHRVLVSSFVTFGLLIVYGVQCRAPKFLGLGGVALFAWQLFLLLEGIVVITGTPLLLCLQVACRQSSKGLLVLAMTHAHSPWSAGAASLHCLLVI